jgi:uncharacterized OB-fold protein
MTWLAIIFWTIWIAAMAWCAMVVARLLRYWKQRDRYDLWLQGRCLECGYDVRATQARCPECGTRLPAPIREEAGR